MTFGIFQDAYNHELSLAGSKSVTGVIGTTLNGVMYLSLPVLSTILDNGRCSRWRRPVAIAGILIESAAFLASSWSTAVWQLILLQGILAALGSAMLFSPTTLFVDEWFRDGNRATAWGVTLASKNIVGTACPFLFYALLQGLGLGFRWTLRIWAAIVLVTGLFGIFIIPRSNTEPSRRPRSIPWSFLKHRTFYIYAIACMIFSAGYGLPQTYLPQFASNEIQLSGIVSTSMIAIFNIPGIVSCVLFGVFSDRFSIAASTNTQISAMGSAFCVFLLWGLSSRHIPALLFIFSIGYGFFASAYSSTWVSLCAANSATLRKRTTVLTNSLLGWVDQRARARGCRQERSHQYGYDLWPDQWRSRRRIRDRRRGRCRAAKGWPGGIISALELWHTIRSCDCLHRHLGVAGRMG